MSSYKIGRATVSRIIQNSQKHLADFEEKNLSAKRCRKLKKTENSDLNILMKEWFDAARARDIVMSGPLIQEQALKYAERLNLPTFKASSGWLHKFCKAYNVSCRTVTGEFADADFTAANDFHTGIPELCKDYLEEDIYNMDETALLLKFKYSVRTPLENAAICGIPSFF